METGGEIPAFLDLEKLPGPKRGAHPAIYFRDEVVWAPNRRHFALAYTIAEASMMNEIGCVLWGTADGRVLGNPDGVHACCWRSPWCRWIDNEIFVFKAQHYDGKTTHTPQVAIHISKGFSTIPESNAPEVWIDSEFPLPAAFKRFDRAALLSDVRHS